MIQRALTGKGKSVIIIPKSRDNYTFHSNDTMESHEIVSKPGKEFEVAVFDGSV
jgi:hypothetical protein